jgi:hypothetical protein
MEAERPFWRRGRSAPRPQQSTLGILNFEKIVRGDICGGLGDDFRLFVMPVEIEGVPWRVEKGW